MCSLAHHAQSSTMPFAIALIPNATNNPLRAFLVRRCLPGFELFCDLCLADCLATGGAAERVVIQLKGHPTFVSDAMAKDLLAMVDLLVSLDEAEYPRSGTLSKPYPLLNEWKDVFACSGQYFSCRDVPREKSQFGLCSASSCSSRPFSAP